MMAPKTRLTVLFAVGVMAGTFAWLAFSQPRLSWRGIARIRWANEANSGDHGVNKLMKFFSAIQANSNSPSFINRLAKISGLKTNQFRFREVSQFRSTSLLEIRYDAIDRPGAEAVSTNAALLLKSMLATNSPTVVVELFDVRSTTVWEETKLKMREHIYRITGW